jgi:hypothetical protein
MNAKIALLSAAMLAATGAEVLAQSNNSCAVLERERQQIGREVAELIAEYPGTAIVLGICAATGQQAYKEQQDGAAAAGAFAVCAAIACSLVGFDNCGAVAKKTFALVLRKIQIEQRQKEICGR